MAADQVFWKKKTLEQMSLEEWESLCDGCGKCCLHKLQDEETEDVFYTRVSCEYLDLGTCRCSDYLNRKSLVPECLELRKEELTDVFWLPTTCAYRLIAEGQPLAEWHPLVSGDPQSVHQANISVQHFAVSGKNVSEEELEHQVIQWVI